MKLFLMSADGCGYSDPITKGQLFDHLPLTKDLASADAVVIPVVCHLGYRFNHDLNRAKGKKLILVNYIEYGWDFNLEEEETRIGYGNFYPCDCRRGYGNIGEWGTLDLFFRENPPALTFQRELPIDKAGPGFAPIDFLYPPGTPKARLSTPAEYATRKFDVFYAWGFSNQARARLHGDIFRMMSHEGINVLSSFSQLSSQGASPRSWVSIYTPWFDRTSMPEIYQWQRQSKIAVAMPGAGRKTFRDNEASNGSLLALQYDGLVRAYPWVHGENCIRMRIGSETKDLRTALERSPEELYQIYANCQRHLDLYRNESYIPNYVIPQIQKHL